MNKYLLVVLFGGLLWPVLAEAQAIKNCKIAFDEVDPFDSLRLVGAQPVALGYSVPSKYELADGPKMIDEAQAIVVYTENDSISGFFLNIVLPEHNFQTIKTGITVKFLLEDESVLGFYNIPDEGQFDPKINMRVYQHTCAVPFDYYYKVAYHKVAQIRVEYDKENRTLVLGPAQQEALRKAFQCVGQQVGVYPVKP
jgi:hypothetical protein